VRLRDSGGSTLTIARKIGEGGEGAVFTTNEQRAVVAKLYAQPLGRAQVAKLETMIRAGDPTLASVAAWPLAMVYEGVRPVGFTMPLLAGQHPLHDLVGPKRRQALFPGAHWNFLVHAALNLARAFEVLHARGVVVGDVNSNNVVVHRDATTHLIDCDSFQIPGAGGALHRCTVGVAEYQPPEFQGKDLSRLDRLPQHDLFGLAVMIFQLLFVGKHPFAGVLPPTIRATGEIGANVAARRFFYGPEAKRLGLKPPPGSIGLGAVTPELAHLFRRAFIGDAASRPSAAAWVAALDDLKTKTVSCRVNAAHRYRAGRSCPWCALEARGLHYFSLAGGGAGGAAGQLGSAAGGVEAVWRNFTDADVERIWSEIAAIAVPAPRSATLPPARSYRTAPLGLWTRARTACFAAGAALAALAGAVCCALGAAPLAVLIVLAALLAGLVARPDARRVFAARRKRFEVARREFYAAEKEWAIAARATRFVETRNRLAALRRTVKEQRRRFDAEVAALQKMRDAGELRRFLRSHVIAVNMIPEIDRRAKAALLAFGIESALDITTASIAEVPQLGRLQRARLFMWREALERSFRTLPRKPPDAAKLATLKQRYAAERRKCQTELLAGAALLRQTAHDIELRRPALEREARSRADAFRQAEADMHMTPLLYRTLIFS